MNITAREISNYDDIIDSRDVIARIEALEANAAELADLEELDTETLNDDERAILDTLRADVAAEAGELTTLRALAEEGETLIRDSYFVTYAQGYAEEIGSIPADAGWPAYCIDWEYAARELRMDYTSVDFDGVTYWAR